MISLFIKFLNLSKVHLSTFKNLWFYLGFSFSLVLGCSFFSVRPHSDNPETGGEFKVTISPQNNPVPMPIEVATEISQIAQGQTPGTGLHTVMTPEEISAPRTVASSPEGELTENSIKGEKNVTPTEQGINSNNPDKSNKDSKSLSVTNGTKAHAGGKTINYKVLNGDTLMKISFATFGDVYRWREIYNINQNKIADFNNLVPGTVLTIEGVEYVVIERNGSPYLIKRHDSLVKISKGLYGTTSEWKNLWYNNKQLIHDPNKIYAGFTMYYKPKETK